MDSSVEVGKRTRQVVFSLAGDTPVEEVTGVIGLELDSFVEIGKCVIQVALGLEGESSITEGITEVGLRPMALV